MGGLIAALFVASLAHAGVADDAAIAADDATSTHCSQAWTGEGAARAEALIAVSTVLGRVDSAYEQTQAPHLLYWRGLIYQCLGQYEDAIGDLEAFVAAESGSSVYAEQVRKAQLQLSRAGRRKAAAGAGAAASWIRRPDPVELGVRVGAGLSARQRACTEPTEPPSLLSQKCVGGKLEHGESGVTPAPVAGRLQARFHPRSEVGVLADVALSTALSHEADVEGKDRSLDRGEPGPTARLLVGPTFRLVRPTGRAFALRLEPVFALAVSPLEPQAGHFDYSQPSETAGQLDGGAWVGVGLGGGVNLAVQAEVGNRAVLEIDASLFGHGSPTDLLVSTRDPEDAVERPLSPTAARGVASDLGLALLLLPGEAGGVAIGPTLDIGLLGSWIDFPTDAWGSYPCPPPQTGTCGVDDSKVFSTRRLGLTATLGLRLELGGR